MHNNVILSYPSSTVLYNRDEFVFPDVYSFVLHTHPPVSEEGGEITCNSNHLLLMENVRSACAGAKFANFAVPRGVAASFIRHITIYHPRYHHINASSSL